MSENLLLAFAFWIDRCRLFAPAAGLCFIIHTLLRFARLKFSAAFRKVNRRTFHCCVKFTVYSNCANALLFTLSIHHDEIPAPFVDLACLDWKSTGRCSDFLQNLQNTPFSHQNRPERLARICVRSKNSCALSAQFHLKEAA